MRALALCLALSAVVPLLPTLVSAQEAQQTALARRLFRQGLRAVERERWDEAVDAFSRSYQIAERPMTLYNLAAAQVRAGQLVAATESYRQFIRQATEDRYEDYRGTARDDLRDVEESLPALTLNVEGLERGDRLELDEESFPRAAVGVEIPVDPGEHTIVAHRGGESVQREFVAEEGETVEVTLTIDLPSAITEDGDPDRDSDIAESLREDGTGEPEDEGGGVFESPVFWTIVTLAVIGGAVAGAFFIFGGEEEPYDGTFGVVPIR